MLAGPVDKAEGMTVGRSGERRASSGQMKGLSRLVPFSLICLRPREHTAEVAMVRHDLRWAQTPKASVRATKWGWSAFCPCGWKQDGLAGSKKDARRAYYKHELENA